ncbi:MAG TPA: carbohydrate ABC transporter permease [Micromonosporaceae bacterium]|jgi:cellobiose transport system permease protein
MAVLTAEAVKARDTSHALGPRRRSRRRGAFSASWLTYTILAIVFIVSVFPFYWTIVAASTSNTEINQVPPNLVPGPNLIRNFGEALNNVNMAKALVNSVIVSGSVSLSTVLFGTLAGFAFAKLRFRGRNLLLGLVIATTFIPMQIGIVPLFILMAKLDLVGQLPAVILPGLVTAFGVFFLRQYLVRALPDELIEAGRIDGASSARIFVSVVLPIARPAMAVLGMLTFMATWNDLFWPLIVLNSDNPTVQVAIDNLNAGYVPDMSIILSGTLLGTLPVLAVFILLGRQIVSGIMQGAIKG